VSTPEWSSPVKVLSQGIPVKAFPEEKAFQIRVPLKLNAKEVVDLALLEVRPLVEACQGRHRRTGAVVAAGLEKYRMVMFKGGEVVNDLEIAVIVHGGDEIKIIEIKVFRIFKISRHCRKGCGFNQQAVPAGFLKAAGELLSQLAE
jgi:hypothetical protein